MIWIDWIVYCISPPRNHNECIHVISFHCIYATRPPQRVLIWIVHPYFGNEWIQNECSHVIKMSVFMSSKWVYSCHQNECIHVISFHCIYAIHVIKMSVFNTLILDPLHTLILNTLIPEVWVDNLMDTLIHVIERSVFMSSHFIVSIPHALLKGCWWELSTHTSSPYEWQDSFMS